MIPARILVALVMLMILATLWLQCERTVAASKPNPISAPLPTATAGVPIKGIIGPATGPWVDAAIIKVDDSSGSSLTAKPESYKLPTVVQLDPAVPGQLRSSPALAWLNTRVMQLAGRQGQGSGLADGPEWEGRAIFPDGQTIILAEPEFAVTFWSVMQQESGFRPEAQNWATVSGVTYEVAGCLQLLLDSGMLALIAEMGYTKMEMYDCPKNVLVAQEYWRRDMERIGRPWRLWVARPQYRADGQSGEW